MFFSEIERQKMEPLFASVNAKRKETYTLFFSDEDIVEAEIETCYETDNGLEEGDSEFEEYHACAMRIVKVITKKFSNLKEGNLIEINYHNYPKQIKDSRGNIL